MLKNKKILFIGAHPDDVEIACGGTIFKIKQDNDIHVVALSKCYESVPKGFEINAIAGDFLNSMNYIQPKSSTLHNFPVRRFSEHRQDILELFVKINKDICPDIVFFHSALDTHQDHSVVYQEAYRAFKNRCMITYEISLNSQDSSFNYIVELSERNVNQKLELLLEYSTQEFRHYTASDYILSSLKYNGAYINKQYAETFKIIKWIG